MIWVPIPGDDLMNDDCTEPIFQTFLPFYILSVRVKDLVLVLLTTKMLVEIEPHRSTVRLKSGRSF